MNMSKPKLGHQPLRDTMGSAESKDAIATLIAGA
jgi:hypothetical protein